MPNNQVAEETTNAPLTNPSADDWQLLRRLLTADCAVPRSNSEYMAGMQHGLTSALAYMDGIDRGIRLAADAKAAAEGGVSRG